MKHTLSLAVIALAFTANALPQSTTGGAIIGGYQSGDYSASDNPTVSKQVADIEEKIVADLSHYKGDVILTIRAYGNADERPDPRKSNQDYGEERASEIASALAGPFGTRREVTVRPFFQTNGTKYDARTTNVYWTITPVPPPAQPAPQRDLKRLWFFAVTSVAILLLAISVIRLARRKPQPIETVVAVTPAEAGKRPRSVFAESNGRRLRTWAQPRLDERGEILGWNLPFTGENDFRPVWKEVKDAFKGEIKKLSDPELNTLIREGKIEELSGGEIIPA